jgi:hypothetical protein
MRESWEEAKKMKIENGGMKASSYRNKAKAASIMTKENISAGTKASERNEEKSINNQC